LSSAGLRGAVVWAVVPYVPEAPFWIYRVDGDPLEVKDAGPLFKAARKAESEFRFLVRAKARPVLVLADTPDPRIDEYLALRLVRLSELSEEARARVVAQQDPLLFHVSGARIPGLAEELAVMIAAPVRVHVSAVDAENVLGRLDASELRVVHERFIKLHKFDLRNLVHEEITRLRELQRQRPPGRGSKA
jgi:hypothetical protein